jgi:hypothetical protein
LVRTSDRGVVRWLLWLLLRHGRAGEHDTEQSREYSPHVIQSPY